MLPIATCITTVWLVSTAWALNKTELKNQAQEMFYHAYNSYVKHAWLADELMPLSCSGRVRGVTQNRGDVDDALGNYALTLIDTLDTLAIMNDFGEFERSAEAVIDHVDFDQDIVVSVFEANIRIVGGLISAHLMAQEINSKLDLMQWYNGELLDMAVDIADRLMPAFNTTTGLPYPRVNLRHGITPSLRRQQDTCTACGGSIILEFAALSRLTKNSAYEEKATRAMDFLWQQRHRSSDLMGTVLNIHNGDWIRRDAGVGAGIDSYYEYCLKAYILLGEAGYLERFNKHYAGISRYLSQGPLLVDVQMNRPEVTTRGYVDALHAFWPGLQVLAGDLQPAIQTHELLYQVIQRHHFLPEAFTHDLQLHWCQHHLRPEFIESTYFLYKATGDEHYLEVGKQVMNSLNEYTRVSCGFAAIRDLRTMVKEDRMDSFVLSETFKYLYLLFAEPEDIFIDVDQFVFTTEAHLLPLSLAVERGDSVQPDLAAGHGHCERSTPFDPSDRICPNLKIRLATLAPRWREWVQRHVEKMGGKSVKRRPAKSHSSTGIRRIRAEEFRADDPSHVASVRAMGVEVISLPDGRVQLVHAAGLAGTEEDAEAGLIFIQDMIALSKRIEAEQAAAQATRVVQILSSPFLGNRMLVAFPGQFGHDFTTIPYALEEELTLLDPLNACTAQSVRNRAAVAGKIAVAERGGCMFLEKARMVQSLGGMGIVVIDNVQSSADSSPPFMMSGDGSTDVFIPSVFLFRREGQRLLGLVKEVPRLRVRLAEWSVNPAFVLPNYLHYPFIYSGGRLSFTNASKTKRKKKTQVVKPQGPPLNTLETENSGEKSAHVTEDELQRLHETMAAERTASLPSPMDPTMGDYLDTPSPQPEHVGGPVQEPPNAWMHHPADEAKQEILHSVLNNPDKFGDVQTLTDRTGLVQIAKLPSGQSQLTFNFEKIETEHLTTLPHKTDAAQSLLDSLRQTTNLYDLPHANRYARLVRHLFFLSLKEPVNPLSPGDHAALQELARTLVIKDVGPPPPSGWGAQDPRDLTAGGQLSHSDVERPQEQHDSRKGQASVEEVPQGGLRPEGGG